MAFLPPFVTYGGLKIKAGNFDQHLTREYLNAQVGRYQQLIDDLLHGRLSETSCAAYDTLNDHFDDEALRSD